MAVAPVVAVEIGTTKTIALVGEMREDGYVMITGMGERQSQGVRKGEITDIESVAASVRGALELAEETGKVMIGQVHVTVSGGHIQSVVNRGFIPVLDKDGIITEDDVDDVMEVARSVSLAPERDILHTICQHFCIDDETRVVRPEGMEGSKLSLDMLILHGLRARFHTTVRVLSSIPVDVVDVAFGGLCSALSVLTPEQKKSGAIVIDMGGGTTDFLAYAGGVVAGAGSLAVGGDHITNDIALGLNVPASRAESLKCEVGSAALDSQAPDSRIPLPAELGFPGRAISLKSLNTIIHARVDEVFETIRKRFAPAGILHQVGAGVVLTGGCAHLKGILDVAEATFELPASVGKPRNVSGLATATEGPEYAACSGLVQYGFRTMVEGQKSASPLGWLKGLFGS